jgi:hypothetical protein
MALGFGNGKKGEHSPSPEDVETKTGFGTDYGGFQPDTEAQGPKYRKMSRIDKPVTKSISGNVDGRRMSLEDAESEDITVGKQMELEAGNAIQYRTCSWQKVCPHPVIVSVF